MTYQVHGSKGSVSKSLDVIVSSYRNSTFSFSLFPLHFVYLYNSFPPPHPLILSVSLFIFHLSCFCNFIDLTLRYKPPLVCMSLTCVSIFVLSFSTHRLKIALLHPDGQMLTPYQAFLFFISHTYGVSSISSAFVFPIAPTRHIPVGINTSTNPSSLCSPRGPCAPHLLQSR